MMNYLKLTTLDGIFAICKLDKSDSIPEWATIKNVYSISRTLEELSIVCLEENVPNDITCERNWRMLKIEGPLDFNLVGILSSIIEPLAKAKISIFAISTYNTDYIMVKSKQFAQTIHVLKEKGFNI